MSRNEKKVLGSESAKIKIVEYGDYQCPHAKEAHQTLYRVMDELGRDQVCLTFRHFPLELHPQAREAAEAAEAAASQGKFWKMHDLLFSTHGMLDTSTLKK